MYENYTTLTPTLLLYQRSSTTSAGGWRWVQEQSKRNRNNAELIFVFKYKVDIGKLSNFVSTVNWPKTLLKGLTKAKLISLTTEERH